MIGKCLLVTADHRETLLDEFERDGLSVMAFCRLRGLTDPTIANSAKAAN